MQMPFKNKVLWFDTETTGVEAKENGLIQLAALMEIDGEVIDEIDLKIKPFKGQIVTAGALQVHGYKMSDLRSDAFMGPQKAYAEFTRWLSRHIDKFNKLDKAYVGGQNVQFDVDFLNVFFQNNDDKYLGSWINWRRLDTLVLAHVCSYLGFLVLPDFKLATLAEYFKIELQAHDALSDIRAARQIFYELLVINGNAPTHFTKGHKAKTVKTIKDIDTRKDPKKYKQEYLGNWSKANAEPEKCETTKKTGPKKGSLDEILALPQTDDKLDGCPVCEKAWDGRRCKYCGHEEQDRVLVNRD